MPAYGIHDHPTLKLGLRPPKPMMPTLRLGDFLTGVVPSHPVTLDYLNTTKGVTFGLYTNDTFGICGPTAVANSRRLTTAKLTGTMQVPTQADVDDLYRRSGNPRFDPKLDPLDPRQDDNGVNLQEMLDEVVKNGIGGVKALAHASVDVSNLDEVAAAIAIFGGVLTGVNLQEAQKAQTNKGAWDYSPSMPWGGHAIVHGAYGPKGEGLISWAKYIIATMAFLKHQLSEVRVVIWPEHLTDQGFLTGVDLRALAAAYQSLTGRPFPAVVPPKPPTPPPAPSGSLVITATLGGQAWSGTLQPHASFDNNLDAGARKGLHPPQPRLSLLRKKR